MFSTNFLRSRKRPYMVLAVLGPLCCIALPLSAQKQTSPITAKAQTINPAVEYDPTKPEVQPNLTVDRDPVLSPDAADNLPSGTEVPTVANGHAGEIQKSKSGMYTLLENVNQVVQYCTVIDEKGQLVTDLKQSDFRVWENGVPQTIDVFQHQDVPVSMGILIDNSGSMHGKHAAVEEAALDLVRASNPQDAEFVVNFSNRAYLDQGFTSNIHALEQGLSHFDPGNTTALYDAVVASADELSKHATQPKQVLLIVTDGADDASRLSLAQAVRRVQRLGGPVVYSIGLLYETDPQESAQARSDLETLSRDTGGIAYFPSSLQDVGEIARQIALDIREQYTIGYNSTRAARLGGYRTVRVEATAPGYKELSVRTRKGYYPNVAAAKQALKAVQAAEVAQ